MSADVARQMRQLAVSAANTSPTTITTFVVFDMPAKTPLFPTLVKALHGRVTVPGSSGGAGGSSGGCSLSSDSVVLPAFEVLIPSP